MIALLAPLVAAAAVTADTAPLRPAAADSADVGGAPAVRAPDDRWLGADKAKHFVLAGFAESVAFGAARTAGLGRRPALVTGAVVATGVSVAKELVDRRRGGRASVRDLVWDAAGMALYAAALARTAP